MDDSQIIEDKRRRIKRRERDYIYDDTDSSDQTDNESIDDGMGNFVELVSDTTADSKSYIKISKHSLQ